MAEERKSIAVDFDGVLHQWDGEWRGHHVILGEPIRGAIAWLYTILQTYDVFILTTRGETFRGRFAIRTWLRKHTPDHMWNDGPALIGTGPAGSLHPGVRNIRITDRKRRALIYIDDRAFRFEGQFPSANRVRGMRPWWKELS